MSSRTRSVSSSKSASSSSPAKKKTCWTTMCCCCIVLIIVLVLVYISRNKSKSDGFYSAGGSVPNLKASSGECVVALFYADWCPHCVAFKPDFKKAMTELNNKTNQKGKKLRLEMVDCDANKTISKQYNVKGFPTVKIINDDASQTEYSGDRSFESLQTYLINGN